MMIMEIKERPVIPTDKDISKLMKNMPGNGNEKKLKASLNDLKRFASSPEGKKLVGALGESGGKTALNAAEGIKNGDAESVKKLVTYLYTTKEGKALADKILEITNGREK